MNTKHLREDEQRWKAAADEEINLPQIVESHNSGMHAARLSMCLSRLCESRARVDELETKYAELVDALCSPSWLGRNRHESVVGLATRLRDKQLKIVPMGAVNQEVGYCIRASGHRGPCNGFAREDCVDSALSAAELEAKE